jgi:hypothetical protein
MATAMRVCFLLLAAMLVGGICISAQARPDFSGTWLLDRVLSGSEQIVWTQKRPGRFVLTQTPKELTIDTGDGSLFGVSQLLIDGPLRYKFDGSVVVVDHTLGDLPDFERKIRTQAAWDGARLITRATHFSETPAGVSGGVTRVVVFSMTSRGQLMVERTGYRDNPSPELFVATLPKYLHRGRLEDDLVYAKDTAFYTKASR